MIHITGDTHGDRGRFDKGVMHGEPQWGTDDILMICGDFGYIFSGSDYERTFLDRLAEKPYTVCFCDGNHENFPALNAFPEEWWNGGRVHRIRRNILHLERGQVFGIEDKSFFVMGGAYSPDRAMRREGISWWREELPDAQAYSEAWRNLDAVGNSVDYIVTHTAPAAVVRAFACVSPDLDAPGAELGGFLDDVMRRVRFRRWYFGHWHTDREVRGRFRALWYDVEDIE